MLGEFDPILQEALGKEYWRVYHPFYKDKKNKPPEYDEGLVLPIDYFTKILGEHHIEHKGLRVLELGCATGISVNIMRKTGINAFGIEISNYILNQDQLIPPEVKPYIYHMDIRNLDIFPDKAFDLCWSNSIVHIPPENIQKHLTDISRISEYFFVHTICEEDPFGRYLLSCENEKRERMIWHGLKSWPWWKYQFAKAGWCHLGVTFPPYWSGWNLFCNTAFEKRYIKGANELLLNETIKENSESKYPRQGDILSLFIGEESLRIKGANSIDFSSSFANGLKPLYDRYVYRPKKYIWGDKTVMILDNEMGDNYIDELAELTKIHGNILGVTPNIAKKLQKIDNFYRYTLREPLFSVKNILALRSQRYYEIRAGKKLYENRLMYKNIFSEDLDIPKILEFIYKSWEIILEKDVSYNVRINIADYTPWYKYLYNSLKFVDKNDLLNTIPTFKILEKYVDNPECIILDPSMIHGEVIYDKDNIVALWLTYRATPKVSMQAIRFSDLTYKFLSDYIIYRSALNQPDEVEFINDMGVTKEEKLFDFKNRYAEMYTKNIILQYRHRRKGENKE